MSARPSLYGLLAEFAGPEELVGATERAWVAGYRAMDAFTPFPVEGLAEALGFHRTRVSLVFLAGGILGGVGGYLLQLWISASAYPINVGGRPYNSVPSFVPVTFELTVLLAALAGFVGLLLLNGLPRPFHPVFDVPRFARVTQDGFFLLIEARDPCFQPEETRRFLQSLGAREVDDVPA